VFYNQNVIASRLSVVHVYMYFPVRQLKISNLTAYWVNRFREAPATIPVSVYFSTVGLTSCKLWSTVGSKLLVKNVI